MARPLPTPHPPPSLSSLVATFLGDFYAVDGGIYLKLQQKFFFFLSYQAPLPLLVAGPLKKIALFLCGFPK